MLSEAEVPMLVVLIESDGVVSVPVRTLVSLISYAMAGPSNDASIDARDRAVEAAQRAMVESYERLMARAESDGCD